MRHSVRYAIAMLALAALAAAPCGADTAVGGTISELTTWTLANSPYYVTNTTVSDGVTLVVEPGVELRFASNHGIVVYGKLVADGTLADPIVFRVTDPTWQVGGITLSDSDPGTILDSCRFTNFAGITITGTGASHSPTISNNFLSCISNYTGITITDSNPVVISNTIRAYHGIYVSCNNAYRLLPVIQENALSSNQSTQVGYGVWFFARYQPNLEFTVDRCHMRGFERGIFYQNNNSSSSNAWNNTYRTKECILYNNLYSIYHFNYSPSYGSYNATTDDCWIDNVYISGAPITTITCTSNYWTAAVPDRCNTTSQIEYVSDRGSNHFEEGDVNGDGDTDQADVEMVMEYLVGSRTLGSLPNAADADADGDADVDMRDATLIRAFYEGLLLEIPR